MHVALPLNFDRKLFDNEKNGKVARRQWIHRHVASIKGLKLLFSILYEAMTCEGYVLAFRYKLRNTKWCS